jgi:hypothetical protein
MDGNWQDSKALHDEKIIIILAVQSSSEMCS